MKKLLLNHVPTLMLSLCLCTLSAQTTAFDWTRSECSTAENINLSNELDAGKVVVLDFVMIPNCGWCIWAGKYLKEVVAPFATSHPGRVKVFSIGFDDTYTCQQLVAWNTQFNLKPDAVFSKGGDEVNYYGGMGMPTIVVVGGSDHKVFYNQLGFGVGDTANASAAIKLALGTVSAVGEPNGKAVAEALQFFPQPASEEVLARANEPLNGEIQMELLDFSGRVLVRQTTDATATARFSTADLPNGIYAVRCNSGGLIFYKKLVVAH